MQAIVLNSYGDIKDLQLAEVPIPTPQEGEVLVKILASAVNPVDWKIAAGYMRDWLPLPMPLILGCEIAGEIAQVGTGVTAFKSGDEIYGFINLQRCGAYAENVIARVSEITHKPMNIDYNEAAALPVGALTAWQAFDVAGLQAGQKILIHAAAGGVGSIAVQLAKARGAYVIGTASARNIDYVKSLGADEVIDYTAVKFEDAVKGVDVVFDLMGGETQTRSLGTLKKGGFLVSVVNPPSAELLQQFGVNGTMIGVQPNAEQLSELAKLVEAGKIKATVASVLPLADAIKANELSQSGRTRGKIILQPQNS